MHKRIPYRIAAGCILLLAVAMRLSIMGNNPQIDEIWSLRFTSFMHSPFDIFSIHSDNNHYLNTLWMYLLGQTQPFWMYRLPSFLCGIGLVAIVMRTEWKKNPTTGTVLGILLACSAFLSLFSAQARGYLPMLFFGYLSFLQMKRTVKTLALSDALLFGLLSIIAFLWQLVYIHLFVALVIFVIAQLWPLSKDHEKRTLFICISPAIVMLCGLAIADLSYLVIGGGPPWSAKDMILSSVTLLFAMPERNIWAVTAGLCALAALIIDVEFNMQHNRPKGLFLITLLLISPVLWLLFFHPTIIYPRYFLAPLFFVLLILGEYVARGLQTRSRLMSVVCALLLSAYLVGNGFSQHSSIRKTQKYTIPLHFLVTHAPDNVITVGSRQDFRTELLLWYYAPRMQGSKKIVFLDHNKRAHHTPDYWLVDTGVEDIPSDITDSGTRYVPMENAPKNGNWMIFRASR